MNKKLFFVVSTTFLALCSCASGTNASVSDASSFSSSSSISVNEDSSKSESVSSEGISSEEEISLPGLSSEEESESIVSSIIGEHYLNIVYPSTVNVTVYQYYEAEDENSGETVAYYGEQMDLSYPLAKGEYLFFVTDNAEDDLVYYMNASSITVSGVTFSYNDGGYYYFNWKDTKDVTLDITDYVVTFTQTGDEPYLGRYKMFHFDQDIEEYIDVIVADDQVLINGTSYYLSKNSDSSFNVGMFGGASYRDGFLYMMDQDFSHSDFYLGYKVDTDSTFTMDTYWESDFSRHSYICETTVNGEKQVVFNKGGELHTTVSDMTVQYENTSLADSSYVFLEDQVRKFGLSTECNKAKFYTTSTPGTHKYFNYSQAGAEMGTYSYKGDPSKPQLILDGFGKCKLGDYEGSYANKSMYINEELVYRVTISIVGREPVVYQLDLDEKTYEELSLINYDPFVTDTTFQADGKFKITFNSGSCKIVNLTSQDVTFSSNAPYTVKDSYITLRVDYEYDYNYDSNVTFFTFKIEVVDDQYKLTLTRDVTIYDEMSDYDFTLYSAGTVLRSL